MTKTFLISHTGRLIISFDFELGWGGIESGRWLIRQKSQTFTNLRPVFKHLILELEAMDIPVVWATVGAMVSPLARHDFEHLPKLMQDNILNFLDNAESETIDGRDLLELILSSRINHEIASHSFSHTRFNFNEYSLYSQTTDLTKSMDALEKYTDNKPSSFVFPQNIVTSFEALSKVGFKVARVVNDDRIRFDGRVKKYMNRIIFPPPPVSKREEGNGLVSHSTSLFYKWGGKSEPIQRKIVNIQARRALKRTVGGSGDTHIWLHPFNLVETPNLMKDFLFLLRYIAELRDKNLLTISTMSEY
jgi:peptidoglycan/xylan/chitin deacetylase (PgdA/CDA1 family)